MTLWGYVLEEEDEFTQYGIERRLTKTVNLGSLKLYISVSNDDGP